MHRIKSMTDIDPKIMGRETVLECNRYSITDIKMLDDNAPDYSLQVGSDGHVQLFEYASGVNGRVVFDNRPKK